MNLPLNTILIGTGLALLQLLLAIPWAILVFLSRDEREKLRENPFAGWVAQRLLLGLGLCVAAPVVFLTFVQDRGTLEVAGRLYAAVLQMQLTVDLFILGFGLMLWLWPKGGAVALAAFREGVRQWMFWLLTLLAALAMLVSIFVPYFTFGEDYLMVKQLGYDTIMLAAVLFGGLAASLSISEEIEGRTAITVMSKPISRRWRPCSCSACWGCSSRACLSSSTGGTGWSRCPASSRARRRRPASASSARRRGSASGWRRGRCRAR
jgi:hypothetical protein